ncbi:hypothetical protein H6G97_31735 [Nostoc flagelliforme FACHB-838]|uniref:Uncharacterized protein n=1 Tax=Nostoc flagelliforme FACHB-838 TaxID=2692904 RepID=A0ABR8DX32_9NOSO|nr:hypothetical protein [Nostoc flagelliforme]MBD2533875.1 hypothetical protein [Nostoc flagelliforme FACHB-838]
MNIINLAIALNLKYCIKLHIQIMRVCTTCMVRSHILVEYIIRRSFTCRNTYTAF